MMNGGHTILVKMAKDERAAAAGAGLDLSVRRPASAAAAVPTLRPPPPAPAPGALPGLRSQATAPSADARPVLRASDTSDPSSSSASSEPKAKKVSLPNPNSRMHPCHWVSGR